MRFAASLGSLLVRYQRVVNVVTGAIVILFGLNYLGVLNLKLFRGLNRSMRAGEMGFLSALVFGMVFSVGWTPCVGAFLGSALMLASVQGHMLTGMGMLFAYSLGLGVPFLLSAVLIDQLKTTFTWIKAHYHIINIVCGVLLILIGLLMATGTIGRMLSLLS